MVSGLAQKNGTNIIQWEQRICIIKSISIIGVKNNNQVNLKGI